MIFRKSCHLRLTLVVLVAFVAALAQAADGDNNDNKKVDIKPEEIAATVTSAPVIVTTEPPNKPEEKPEAKSDDKPEDKPDDNKESVDFKIDQMIVRGREKIRQIITDLREKLDADLIDIFPNLKDKIIALHGNINSCYDATISKNVTVDIFKTKLHDVVLKFFTTHDNLLEGLTHEKVHKRLKAFLSNVAVLIELLFDCVKDHEKGLPHARLGLTPMAAYSREEYNTQILNNHLMAEYTAKRLTKEGRKILKFGNLKSGGADDDEDDNDDGTGSDECKPKKWEKTPIPKAFNWVDQGKVTQVYQQLQCGSCYVYSTTSAMESAYLIRANKTVKGFKKLSSGDNNDDNDDDNETNLADGYFPSDDDGDDDDNKNDALSEYPIQRKKEDEVDVHYSVQATLDCMSNGCDGGSLQEPLGFFASHGVSDYKYAPYLNKAETCRKDYPIALKARRFCYFTDSEEESMQRLLMRHGPAGVAIDANASSMMYLKDSPYTAECGKALDHAVLLVGWDEKYWIIKNSWGPGWGKNGYLYLPRGENKCGIQMMYGATIVDPIKDA